MDAELPRSARRVAEAASGLGLDTQVVVMPQSTRTAEEAAAACRCAVGQIVKSLVFRGKQSGRPYLLLVSGANRVDVAKVAADVGEALVRPDAEDVRAETGYAIGGIPPFGHDRRLATFIDTDLLAFAEIWAAAGTPNCVMRLEPAALEKATGARRVAVK